MYSLILYNFVVPKQRYLLNKFLENGYHVQKVSRPRLYRTFVCMVFTPFDVVGMFPFHNIMMEISNCSQTWHHLYPLNPMLMLWNHNVSRSPGNLLSQSMRWITFRPAMPPSQSKQTCLLYPKELDWRMTSLKKLKTRGLHWPGQTWLLET